MPRESRRPNRANPAPLRTDFASVHAIRPERKAVRDYLVQRRKIGTLFAPAEKEELVAHLAVQRSRGALPDPAPHSGWSPRPFPRPILSHPPVVDQETLVGLLSLEDIGEWLMLHASRRVREGTPPRSIRSRSSFGSV